MVYLLFVSLNYYFYFNNALSIFVLKHTTVTKKKDLSRLDFYKTY